MAGRLKSGERRGGVRRRVAWAALLLAVLLGHGFVTHQVSQRMADFSLARSMPARIEVTYVRELEPAAPPAVAPAPAPARPKRAAAPARSASAPKPQPQEVVAQAAPAPPAASEPEPAADTAVQAPQPEPPTESMAAAQPETPPAPAVAPAASEPASAAQAEPFDWPASTRISYVLTGNVRGEVAGDAQVEWVRAGTRYQVHLDLSVGPSFAPIITRKMSSDGELTDRGLVPRRYDEDTQAAFRSRRRSTLHFEPDAIVMADGQRRDSLPGVQDTASQFVQLTYLFTTRPELLRVGGSVEVPLALPRKVDRWIYDVLREEVLQTPFGPVPTFYLKPRRAVQKGGDLVAEIWFSPQLRYLPVRIRIQQDADTFLDLMIARRPQLAGP